MDFYMFLPSNASPKVYPDNTTCHFKTELAQRMELHGHWQAALIELHYPNTIAHIVQGDNDITLVSDSYIDTVSARPGSFSSTKDFLIGIGDALKSFGNNNNVVDTQPFTLLPDQRIKFMPFDVDEKTKVHFSPRLALQLGLAHTGPYPANEEILGVKPVDISLGIPSQMFIYMDVLEEQIISHTRAPLLRTVPVDTKAQYGSMTVVHFDHPIYFDLRTKSFDTLEIYIKDHAGRNVPFDFGTSTFTMTRQDHITEFYLRQAGGGQYYAGSSYQKGHGIGSWLGGLFRTVLPLLKSGATAVGREAARAGAHVLADVASGDNFADSAKRHAGEAVQNLKRKAASAMNGSGRSIKRKRLAPIRHTVAKARSRRSSTPDYLT
ncbi:DNA-directed RNA polymerase subunit beta' [Frankliniella fusca]|uniref:DNA-directed RNA polymerase subunit beta n=1 Tax=Frankliniella fusca TaxID=407009 RepID=A0AAE1HH91_9NEOP|nr:DNA-directed RNA polymerase subunit beta' [Frankliniella fusca]